MQHITNEFWCRWHKEFVHTLQKDSSGQQKSETSESMILYCLKKMHQEINGHYVKLSKQIQVIKELLGVSHCLLVLMIITIVNKYWNAQSQNQY